MPTHQALLSHAEFTTEAAPCSDSASESGPVGGSLSALRLVPVPETGPPFDGDLPAAAAAAAAAAWPSGMGWDGLGQGALVYPADWTGSDARAGTQTSGGARTRPGTGSQAVDTTEGTWSRQFALMLTEALAGARPLRQLFPLTTDRARAHLDKLMPLFADGQRPRVRRVLMNRPTRDAIEMTVVVGVGTRTHALAVRLERAARPQRATRPRLTGQSPPQWLCTAIEAA